MENSFGISVLLFIGPHYLHCCGKPNSIQQPASEVGVAQKIAYQKKRGMPKRFRAVSSLIDFQHRANHP